MENTVNTSNNFNSFIQSTSSSFNKLEESKFDFLKSAQTVNQQINFEKNQQQFLQLSSANNEHQEVTQEVLQKNAQNQFHQIEPEIVNIVSTFDVKCQLDIKQIALKCRNCEYNPRRFSGAIMRLRDPKTTALIFQTGKIVVVGAKTVQQSRSAALKFANIIKKQGFENVIFNNFKVVNIVGTFNFQMQIKINHLDSLAKFSQNIKKKYYEPECFPGFICEVLEEKVTILIFHTGKIVLTGAKNLEDINTTLSKIQQFLKDFFRKPDLNPKIQENKVKI